MKKFSEMIKTLSSLFIVLFGVSVIAMVIYETYSSFKNQPNNTVAIKINEGTEVESEVSLKLGRLQKVYGTNHHLVEITSIRKGISRSYSAPIRNILFFKGDELNQGWLFPHHDSVITTFSQLTSDSNDDKVTIALFYEFIENDSNNDGKLDQTDMRSIALSLPSGEKLKILDQNITSIISHIISQDNKALTVLMHQGDKVLLKRYSLQTFEKLNEQELTNISKPS